jgi:hypothetical protein
LQLISEVRIARADPVGANTALLAGRAILQQQLQYILPTWPCAKAPGKTPSGWDRSTSIKKEWAQAEKYFREYRDHSDQLAAAAPADVDAGSTVVRPQQPGHRGSAARQRRQRPTSLRCR